MLDLCTGCADALAPLTGDRDQAETRASRLAREHHRRLAYPLFLIWSAVRRATVGRQVHSGLSPRPRTRGGTLTTTSTRESRGSAVAWQTNGRRRIYRSLLSMIVALVSAVTGITVAATPAHADFPSTSFGVYDWAEASGNFICTTGPYKWVAGCGAGPAV